MDDDPEDRRPSITWSKRSEDSTSRNEVGERREDGGRRRAGLNETKRISYVVSRPGLLEVIMIGE